MYGLPAELALAGAAGRVVVAFEGFGLLVVVMGVSRKANGAREGLRLQYWAAF
jgi:hypothetical protein